MLRGLPPNSYRKFATLTKLYPLSPFESNKGKMSSFELEIIRPDDFHHHLRDGDVLEEIVHHTSSKFLTGGLMFGIARILPNEREA